MPRLLLSLLALWAATPAVADVSDDSVRASLSGVEASFARFVADWMEVERDRAAREEPRLRPGARAPLTTYRTLDEHYRVELRGTGHPDAPYVGVVHYTELVYTCRDLEANDCSVAVEHPRATIFRYREGRWGY